MRRIAQSLIVIVVVAGCGSSHPARSTTTRKSTPRSTTARNTLTTSSPARSTTTRTTLPRAGIVDAFQPKGGTVDGSVANVGTLLRSGSLLTTDPQGTIDFHLDQKLRSCRALEGSQARIEPTTDVLIGFEVGTFLCATTTSGPLTRFTGGSANQQFFSNDPVFVVRVHTDGSLQLDVIEGFLGVTSSDGTTSVIGPDQTGDLVPNQPPAISSLSYSDLPPDEQTFLGPLLQAGTNAINYPTANTQLSPTLARVFQRGLLRIAVTEPPDQTTVRDFTRRMFANEFVDHWDKPQKAEVVVNNATAADAAQLLSAGEVDLVITDTPTAGQEIPLVQDDSADIWYITHDPTDTELDRVLADSMRTVLVGTCTSSTAPVTNAAPDPSCYDQIRNNDLFTQPQTTPLGLFAQLLGLQQ